MKEIDEIIKIIDKDEYYGLADKTPELIATAIYNAGYRKVYDDRFILKHDKSGYNLTEQDAKNEEKCNKCWEQVRKKTAKEILSLIEPDCIECDEQWFKGCNCLKSNIRDKIKQKYGVENEEKTT